MHHITLSHTRVATINLSTKDEATQKESNIPEETETRSSGTNMGLYSTGLLARLQTIETGPDRRTERDYHRAVRIPTPVVPIPTEHAAGPVTPR